MMVADKRGNAGAESRPQPQIHCTRGGGGEQQGGFLLPIADFGLRIEFLYSAIRNPQSP
jgi:hypothetical protein